MCGFFNTARTVCAGHTRRNCKARDNANAGVRAVTPRARRWAIGLVLGYWAFLSLLVAVGMGWHICWGCAMGP